MVLRIEENVALNTEIEYFPSKEAEYERFLRENQAYKDRFKRGDLTLPDLDREAVAWYDTFEVVHLGIGPDGPIYLHLIQDHWTDGTGKRVKSRPASSSTLLSPLLPGSRRALLKMKKMDLYRKAQAQVDNLPDIGNITKGELADRILDAATS